MQTENTVTVSGTLHLIQSDGSVAARKKYLPLSVRQETPRMDGSVRKDFLLARIYDPQVQVLLKELQEGVHIRIRGDVRSSLGSGEMYINVLNLETL